MEKQFVEMLIGTTEHYVHICCPRCNHVMALGAGTRDKSKLGNVLICTSCIADESQGNLIPFEKWRGVQNLLHGLKTEKGRIPFIKRMPSGTYCDVLIDDELVDIHLQQGKELKIIVHDSDRDIEYTYGPDGKR